ncbi:tetratricopeptide repeat protein [Corallococcus sp. AS-1-12]|uniref:tetratricopeptide repeat protein n=1 Tax=Corallococcus sp. AS-1-12 TaxID=2874598 RepID=UPI001CC094F1|nr:tetratricopeptide repeat protein [Corallococcus sp. AS-1-12]MBZ4334447.1 sel1 repeat family protein [Corallococcus sp. AS-1-12]
MKELQLLTQQELELPLASAATLGDRAKTAILLVRHMRNAVSHEAPHFDPTSAETYFQAALITLLVSINKHRAPLRHGLSNLITARLKTSTIQSDALRIARSERESHLRKFKGRESLIADTVTHLKSQAQVGGYTLLTAPEGFGKSAMAAQLTESLQTTVSLFGSDSQETAKACPWLPFAIYFTGKQANSIYQLVEILILQINSLLMQPVASLTIGDWELSRTATNLIANTSDKADTVRSSTTPGDLPQKPIPRKSESTELRQVLRATLYTCLERLAEERGETYIIIDSLDELNLSSGDTSILPQTLPPGISVLLTSRDEKSTSDIRSHLRPAERILTGLTLQEVAQLTQVTDQRWNEVALKSSRGAPLFILTLAEAVRKAAGDHTQVDPSLGPSEILNRQVQKWRTPNLPEQDDPLYQSMLLLSVLEPVSAVDLDLIKGFLADSGIPVSRNSLHEILSTVSSQIDGLADGKIKLSVRAFASHVFLSICGKKDLRHLVLRVSTWLAREIDADVSLHAAYLKHWTDPTLTADPVQRESALKLIELLEKDGNYSLLFNIYTLRPKDEENIPEGFRRSLRAAAEGDHKAAARELAQLLLTENNYGDQLYKEGEQWLRKAISLGDAVAPTFLGFYLMESDQDDEERLREGERLLLDEAEHANPIAAFYLGEFYLSGDGPLGNPSEGERLLCLASTSDDGAKLSLGIRLLDGRVLPKDAARGEALLREAANANHRSAMLILGNRLIDGRGIEQNSSEGEAWIRRAIDAGEVSAMLDLGLRFLEGKGLPQSESEGENWYKKAVDTGDTAAMIELGRRYIDGAGFSVKNPEAGLLLYKKAIAEGDKSAMLDLGSRYLDSKGLGKNTVEGERLLREASQKNYAPAMLDLALRLMDGRGLKKSTVEGRQLLFKAAQKGHPPSMEAYAYRLFTGNGYQRDSKEGQRWLTMAAKKNLTSAMINLGIRFVEGDHVVQNRETGERWLRKAVRLGSIYAQSQLATLALDGKIDIEKEEALSMLDKAASAGDASAIGELAFRLRLGLGQSRDKEKADHWLREAERRNRMNTLVAMGHYARGRAENSPGDFAIAAKHFKSESHDDTNSAANLAYMIRRGETGGLADLPALEKLLNPGVTEGEPGAIINEALRRAQGADCIVDWRRADELIALLHRGKGSAEVRLISNWWLTMAQAFDDGEGHLVLGWLARHRLIVDPQGLTVAQRMELARERFWIVPEWMNLPKPV